MGREGRTALLLLLGARVSSEGNQAASEPATHAVVTADQVKFAPIEIPGFASGLKIAVVHGDPNATSGSYVIRLVFPDGYKIPPHWHPAYEHVTAVSGTVGLGMGDVFDKGKGATLGAGGFAWMAPTTHHFFWAETDAVIQLHGMGPWQLYYLNPGDDPRTAKK